MDDIPQIGEVIDGVYKLVEEVGRGGFGAVYRAEHIKLHKSFAVKLLHPKHASDDKMLSRFENEARAISRLEHPNVVQVFDVGRTPSGASYILMEFLRGVTLQARYKEARDKGNHLGVAAVWILYQVARALVEAHRLGIIHRDLKPANIMLVPDEDAPDGTKVKLMDFGVAKLLPGALGGDTGEGVHTSTGAQQPGTLTHMAPEQVRAVDGKLADPSKIDVWALGVVAFQMFAGRLPFYHPETFPLMLMIVEQSHEPLDKIDPDLPKELVQITHEMLAKDPDKRPAMQQVRDRLGKFLGRSSISIAPVARMMSPTEHEAMVAQAISGGESGVAPTVDEPGRQAPASPAAPPAPAAPVPADKSTEPGRQNEPPEGAPSSGMARGSGEQVPGSAKNNRRGRRRLLFGGGVTALAMLAIAAVAIIRHPTPKVNLPASLANRVATQATEVPPAAPAVQPAPPTPAITPQTTETTPPLPAKEATTNKVAAVKTEPGIHRKPVCQPIAITAGCITGTVSDSDKQSILTGKEEAEISLCPGDYLTLVARPALTIKAVRGVRKDKQQRFLMALRGIPKKLSFPGEVVIQCKR